MSKVRISCASLASIKIDNKYLILLNKSAYKNGIMRYSAIGGALEYDTEGRKFLDNLDAEYERSTPDLRLRIDESNLDIFEHWFYKKIGREIGIDRELIEELVDEEGIFDNLNSSDFSSKYITTVKTKTKREIINYFYFEIYDIKFSDEKVKQIKENIKNSNKLILISEHEFENWNRTDCEVAGNVKSIFN